jgi:pimeloyl-ACP methyl ester carboxylesterase
MPVIDNHGVRLSYDVLGSGRPLILMHGWSCDRGWWNHAGFVTALSDDHLVVNVDLRGHGESSHPHDPEAYSAAELVGDVLAVADAEGIERFAIWGLSYGGWIGWLAAAAHQDRVAALVTSGAWDPRPESLDEVQEYWDTDGELAALREGGTAGMVAYRKKEYGEQYSAEITDWMETSFLAGDAQALLACQHPSVSAGAGLATFEGYSVPTLLFSGELEDSSNEAATIAGMVPDGQSLWLEGLGHAGACAASELSVPTARSFLDLHFPQSA